MSIEKWNERYRAGEGGRTDPSWIVVQADGLANPGAALDLACGAGRNAHFLAEKGWKVTAVDGSEAAISLVRGVDARVIDLERAGPLPFEDETFDLVCIIHFLHRPLFAEARRVVRKGGLIAASIETSRSTMNRAYVIEPGELRTFFDGLEVMVEVRDTTEQIVVKKR